MDPFFYKVMWAGVVAGASTGMLGVYVVGMRIPFLGVCVAHAALAGAVFGSLLGLSREMLMLPALGGAVTTALLLGLLDPDRLRADTNVVLSILFSLSMGLAFLGIGLFSRFGRSNNDVLGLLWGNLLFCDQRDVLIMSATGAAALLYVMIFAKEMRAIMFSRSQALAAGIQVALVWTGFLILTSAVLTVNFQTVGGLMIYSLMANPAAAAFQLVRGHGPALAVAVLLGALSGLGGFLVAYYLDLPVGAVIVVLSSLLVVVAAITGHARRHWWATGQR